MTKGLLVLLLVLCAAPSVAAAAPHCDPGIESWVARCARAERTRLEIVTCDGGVVVVRAADARLDVELRSSAVRSFVSAGEIGLSPVGQFADWSKESDARRAALKALEHCATRDADLPVDRTGANAGSDRREPRQLTPPWLSLFAVAALGVALRRLRLSQEAVAAVLLGVFTGLLRWWAFGGTYFHQNGQGPVWVGYALRDDPGLSSYGPGFHQIFAAAALSFGTRPEIGIWLTQSVLAASVVPAAWLVARRLGAEPWLGAAVGVACAIDPLLGRLAMSESYFATALSFAMLAAAACALAEPRPRSAAFWIPVCAAALLLAQLVRLHPLVWPAAIIAPIPLVFGPGSFQRRARVTLLGGLVIAVVVFIASGTQMLEVVRGPLGQKWLPSAGPRWEVFADWKVGIGLALLALAGVALRSWRGAVLVAVVAITYFVARSSDLMSDPNPAVTDAHRRMFLPAVVCLAIVVATRLRFVKQSQRGVAAVVVVAALLAIPTGLTRSEPATDSLEASWFRGLRSGLAPNASVAYLERAGSQISVLPLYAGERAPLSDRDSSFDLGTLPAPAYYFRSSLCSTPHGQPVCAAIEGSASLELVSERILPARPSMRWHAYVGSDARVALYRIRP